MVKMLQTMIRRANALSKTLPLDDAPRDEIILAFEHDGSHHEVRFDQSTQAWISLDGVSFESEELAGWMPAHLL